jgi:pimeloyl-[acyl-carrier protein] methyl ester esterase
MVLAARARSVLTCDVRAEVGKISAPILYLRAKQDRLVKKACSDQIQRSNPHVTEVALEGPHLILQQNPSESASAVVEFIQDAIRT